MNQHVRVLHKRMQLKPITAIIVLLLVVASLLVSGCIQNAPQAQATAAPTTVPTVEPTQAAVLVSAKQVTVPQSIGTFAPQTGDKYVGFYCTVTNVAAERLMVNQYDWVLRDTTGGVYQPTAASFYPNIGGLQLTTTIPGDIVKGNVIFEVPQNAQLKSITYAGTSNWVVFNL